MELTQQLPQTAHTEARLAPARTEAIAEMGRTDAKASALLTVLSLPLAALAAAMLLVLLIVRPRLGGDVSGSYLHWATCTPREAAADIALAA